MRYSVICLCLVLTACHRMALGERTAAVGDGDDGRTAWRVAVNEVTSMQGRIVGVEEVVSYGDSVRIRFSNRDAVSIVARVLNAGGPRVQMMVRAPDPGPVAIAATAGGFPAERITTQRSDAIILLAALRPAAPSVRSSPRQ